jgi:putative tryptophan/tyrosine transport system substrate-binding protein
MVRKNWANTFQVSQMRRRQFIGLIGGAAAWPLAARGQQASLPVIGSLSTGSAAPWAPFIAAFLEGLGEAGFVDGRNVKLEYRWAEGQLDRLPRFAAELVEHKVAVILAHGGSAPAKAAQAATSTIPIVFVSSADPLRAGIVTSINRPGGNVTGVSMLGSALESKRLGLLHEVFPGPMPIGVLLDPKYPDVATELSELQEAADALKRKIIVAYAGTVPEIDAALASVAQQGAGALLVAQDPFFGIRREQLVDLAARHKLPAIYVEREFAKLGGLLSYGTNFTEAFHQAAIYVAKILKGAKPADLPVIQPTKFEFVINLGTARQLGLEIPATMLARADEVIE